MARWRKGISSSPRFSPDVEEEHTIAREEIFGPVLAIMRAKDFEDAMRIANNIPFGPLVVHSDHQSFARLRVHLPRGSRPADGQPAQRGRGVSASLRRHQGFQLRPKEQGPAALEFYSDYKTVYLKY
jgi:acyl-CoA reductase-like NAD-dependent aldehyde dehydrogenase